MGYILKVKDDKGNVIGIPAIQGENGRDGVDGVDGVDGKSAYQIAVDNGFEGTEAKWAEIHFRAFYVGTSEPDSSIGNDGDIYLKYAEG